MKKLITISILTLLSLTLFSACGGESDGEEADVVNDTLSAQEKDSITQEERENELENVQEIKSRALSAGDSELCNEISDENHRNTCILKVVEIKARELNDPSVCEEIGIEEMTQACKEGLE